MHSSQLSGCQQTKEKDFVNQSLFGFLYKSLGHFYSSTTKNFHPGQLFSSFLVVEREGCLLSPVTSSPGANVTG